MIARLIDGRAELSVDGTHSYNIAHGYTITHMRRAVDQCRSVGSVAAVSHTATVTCNAYLLRPLANHGDCPGLVTRWDLQVDRLVTQRLWFSAQLPTFSSPTAPQVVLLTQLIIIVCVGASVVLLLLGSSLAPSLGCYAPSWPGDGRQ